MSVSKRFDTFLKNIALTDDQVSAGKSRREAVVGVLNANYYSSASNTLHSKFVGSWGKATRVRPPRDVDVLYELPSSVHQRFEARTGNKQSQLLQEIKSVLSGAFPSTHIKGDGPVVQVGFSSYNVELIPSFLLTSGQYWVCMTKSGGYYKTADYTAEGNLIQEGDSASKGNLRHLIRMMKRWQAYCSVPLKSFYIELTAHDFLTSWQYKGNSSIYYDYMVRDYLVYLIGRANSYVYAPGTYEAMPLGDSWVSKANTALQRATKACDLESSDSAGAGDEWQKIFSTDIPKYI